MTTCPYCAEDISPDVQTCPYCKSEIFNDADDDYEPPQKRGMSGGMIALIVIVGLLGCGAVVSVPIALMLPAVQQAREAARRTQCKNNLKQIGLALHTYHEMHQSFPPAYYVDDNGKPLYSWRVGILPYLDEQALYDQFDKTKAWDAPENAFILESMPLVFQCPTHEGSVQTNTAYAGIFGQNCAFSRSGRN
ncbi:MAG: hypothetical protein CMJ78_09905 [Planctomycetaceae bacterium]|nr:hypothetical protein [Planctomycetaceae bacterium]